MKPACVMVCTFCVISKEIYNKISTSINQCIGRKHHVVGDYMVRILRKKGTDSERVVVESKMILFVLSEVYVESYLLSFC
jgi:hypothetical protein